MKLSVTQLASLVLMSCFVSVDGNAQSAFNLGVSYNSGGAGVPYYGTPVFTGAAAGSVGAIGGCVQSPAFYGVGQIGGIPPQAPYLPVSSIPSIPSLPIVPNIGWNTGATAPIAPPLLNPGIIVPPAVQYQQSLALQAPYYNPMPMNCVPCSARPQYVGPVVGGPLVSGFGDNFASTGGNVFVETNKNAWEIDDNADTVWATAMGVGMNTSSLRPLAFPQQNVMPQVGLYSTGDRDEGLVPRVHDAN